MLFDTATFTAAATPIPIDISSLSVTEDSYPLSAPGCLPSVHYSSSHEKQGDEAIRDQKYYLSKIPHIIERGTTCLMHGSDILLKIMRNMNYDIKYRGSQNEFQYYRDEGQEVFQPLSRGHRSRLPSRTRSLQR